MPSKKIDIVCPVCHEKFERYSHSVKKAIRQSGLWLCQTCTLKRRNHAHAKPLMSKRRKGECIEIKTENGWMFEHRYIIEQHLGRRLDITEAVHHRNRNRSDNRIENLEVMGHGEHTKLHHTGLKRSMETRAKISKVKRDNHVYEKHPAYKHITISMLRSYYLKYGTVMKASQHLNITKRTFYNKLNHFNLTMEELCQA